jgi:hypothetical protein
MQKRATALATHKLAQLDGASNGQTTPARHAAPVGEAEVWRRNTPPAPLPEAPASVNVRILVQGRDVQVTLRGTDETRLLARLETLLSRYPVPEASTPAVAAPLAATAPQPTPEGWCLVHLCQMTRQTNARGSWYNHQTAAGWCKGR